MDELREHPFYGYRKIALAVALKDSSVLVITPPAIDAACTEEPSIGMKIAQEVGNDFYDLLVSIPDSIFAPPSPSGWPGNLLSLAVMTEGDRAEGDGEE